jgi:hypothetical protein
MDWILITWILCIFYNILVWRGEIAEEMCNGSYMSDYFYNGRILVLISIVTLGGPISSVILSIYSFSRYRNRKKDGLKYVFMCFSYTKYKIIAEQNSIPIKVTWSKPFNDKLIIL